MILFSQILFSHAWCTTILLVYPHIAHIFVLETANEEGNACVTSYIGLLYTYTIFGFMVTVSIKSL